MKMMKIEMIMQYNTLLIFPRRSVILPSNNLYIVKYITTTKALLSSDDENSYSSNDSPSSNDDNLTNHERYSAEYPSNLYNRTATDIPTNYLSGYVQALTGRIRSIDDDEENAEEKRASLQNRLDEIKEEAKTRPPLTSEDFSDLSSSSDEENMSETDNISRLMKLNSVTETRDNQESTSTSENRTNIEPSSTKKRKFEEEQGESSVQPASRIKQDSSDIQSDTEFPDIYESGGE